MFKHELDKIMSDSRLKYNLKKEQAFTNILYQLLDSHDVKNRKIIGWGKKLQGYGIKQTDFNLFENSTYRVDERIFRNNKKDLLDKKFIRVFDKSNHVKNGPYYSITPLGLFYLFQNMKNISDSEITGMFKLLSFYSLGENKSDVTFLKHFTEQQKLKAIKDLFRYCKFDIDDERIIFSIYIPLFSLNVIFLEARISSKDIDLNIAHLVDTYDLPAMIDDDELNWQIAFTLRLLLSYYLYVQMENKKNILKLPRDFQKSINSVTYLLGSSLQSELDEISKLRMKTFGTADVLEVQKMIKN